jgi:hypothetical protein
MAVNASPLKVSAQFKIACFAMIGVGALAFLVTLFKDKERAWYAYLTAYYYFVTLALGGLFFVSILNTTKAGWSANIRRFPEALTAFLPYALGAGVLFLFGAPHVYEWLNKAEVAKDALLQHKSSYLNQTFFAIRLIAFLGIWVFYARKLIGFSTDQDKSGDESLTTRALPFSVSFIIVFALSFSLFSVDLIMSLQPHWFSTIFGVYCFAGLFQSSLAAMILMIIYCLKRGLLKGYVDENHLHDMGKFLFAFTVFWAYIAYSQYMLIWYANLPEETVFFIPRMKGSWAWVSLALVTFRFVVPFLFMLPRWVKRSPNHLRLAAILILIMQYVDLYWLIYPTLNKKEVIFGLPEILLWVGFAGLFGFAVSRFLAKFPIVPLKDPRQHESMHHHVIY